MTRVEFELDLYVTNIVDETLVEDEVGRIMDALVDLSATDCGVSDPAISLNRATWVLTVELAATAQDFDAAAALADSSIRSAIHAAGGRTPNWGYAIRQTSAQRAELAEA